MIRELLQEKNKTFVKYQTINFLISFEEDRITFILKIKPNISKIIPNVEFLPTTFLLT